MAMNFPDSPSNGDTVTLNSKEYSYSSANSTWSPVTSSDGGSASIVVSDTAPVSPSAGDMWFDSTNSSLLVYYNDGSSSQWVGVSGAAGATGATGPAGPGVVATFVADMAALIAITGMSAGDQVLVVDNNKLFMYTGSAWYMIAQMINASPTAISGVAASYILASNGSATTITAVSTDPEGFPLTWSYAVTTGSLGSSATVSQTDNVFTITPSTDSADAGEFSITFSVTDGGTGVVNAISAFTLSFTEGDYFWTANTGKTVNEVPNANVNTVFGSNVATYTRSSYLGYGSGATQNDSAVGADGALVVDLTSSGGFNALTDLIVFSFLLPDVTSGVTIGMSVRDSVTNASQTLATNNGLCGLNYGDDHFSFDNWTNNTVLGSQWVIGTWGGGYSINTFSNTSASGFRMWPAQTGGTNVLGTEIGSGITQQGGWANVTIGQPGMVFWSGGDAGSYTGGYTARNALEYYVRSFQVYYDQTTSGRTIEQIVGKHQELAFT